jgi:hypothetical protein
MTAEEKREQLLKRALPGLAITIIYFVFVSGMVSEKMKKAETDYKNLMSSGVSKDALPSVVNEQSQTQQRLTETQKKVTDLQSQFNKMAGFLSTNSNSTNAVMAKLAKVFEENQVRIRKDEKSELSEAKLSPALKEIWQSIKPVAEDKKSTDKKKPADKVAAKKPTDTVISVRHLWLKGSYPDMYKALMALTEQKLQILPVALTMQMPASDTDNATDMDWELILWM